MIDSYSDITSSVETTLSALVAEGLARIGFTENGGSGNQWGDAASLLNYPSDTPQVHDSILSDDGKAVLPPPGIDVGNLTKLHWSITISGYAYKADSTAYYLSFTALSLYVILALGHLAYSLYTSESSDAWHSFEDLLVLSHSSRPDYRALSNASAGIRCNSTLKKKVRIRVVESDGFSGPGEELQLLFETAGEEGFRKVVVGDEYGAFEGKDSGSSSGISLS